MLSFLRLLALSTSCLLGSKLALAQAKSPIHLATHPNCSPQASFNKGINLSKIKTIYAFGDSWSADGQNRGGPPPPPVQSGDKPDAGFRASNGKVWLEYLAQSLGATLKDYAQGGAVIDLRLSPARSEQYNPSDMIRHVNTYLGQHNAVDSATSLAIVCYGINDYSSATVTGQSMLKSADVMIAQIQRLIQSGLHQVLVLSPPIDKPIVRQFNNRASNGLKTLQAQSYAYVEMYSLWDAITANPASFGYVDSNACVASRLTLRGACKDPEVHPYYIPGHPSTLSHSLISQWVMEALVTCR